MLSITVARSACLKRLKCLITLSESVLGSVKEVVSSFILIRFLSEDVKTESHIKKKMI